MRIYVDLDSLDIVVGPGDRSPVPELRFKRGTAPALELQFLRDGVPELLPTGTVIRFGPKVSQKFDGTFVIFTDVFTAPSTVDGFYRALPNFNTTALNTLLKSPDGDPDNDVPEVTLMAEFSWRTGAAAPQKSNTFSVVVANAVDNGSEVAPSEAGPSLDTRISALESTAVRVNGDGGIDVAALTGTSITCHTNGAGGSAIFAYNSAVAGGLAGSFYNELGPCAQFATSTQAGTNTALQFRRSGTIGFRILWDGTFVFPSDSVGRLASRKNLGGFVAIAQGSGVDLSAPSGTNFTLTSYSDNYDPSGSHAAGSTIVPRTSVYLVSGTASPANPAGAYSAVLYVAVNGVVKALLGQSSYTSVVCGAILMRLNAGDVVTLVGWQNSGSAKSWFGGSQQTFSVVEQVTD